MENYKNKEELISEIRKTAGLFIKEFEDINEEDKDALLEGVDRTPSQMIAYQLGWMNLILSWDEDELNGKEVITPSPNYKWNKLGGLYASFYAEYESYSLSALQKQFNEVLEKFIDWFNNFSDEEVFNQDVRKWASSTTSRWPICKWVHINTVAPFKSFRTRIRKWKKVRNKK
ncbi:ClbS/DfsB family four-helix bundle protein [Anaerosalibacter bizertensis]|uniref:ClbS/DfsB family four-helix bundle protein n=1 Tax=Anaerosalibacter bizertensis TaxID=932217 RepID=UPI001D00B8EF|nr:ClbS/DfsB family four-helix bundle protein [Anaerosalibacter bizertensis]MBV1820324.1 ClbS/DfsB family four-helix bundle protein [Bacteroidales bacterium MSK.15.36]MCB5558670.1 ClbS/DfsB family four-helix bundle protein [Anaerosalibacter bizertensis]MCG4586263.1 ClbS/DfsB family four-helix bundle protein [Anaerosalibacter bizertensis]